MKPTLVFEKKHFKVGSFGDVSGVPDILGRNRTQAKLTDEMNSLEAKVGYGSIPRSYPYPQQMSYHRTLSDQILNTAILENDYLKAVFLPSLGGRLWSLMDKKSGKNLLYTNDVIRFSNLAVCNAWFSGGVEWNIGLIGHSPFTTKQIFTARLKNEDGDPVLRMYEYERIRSVVYQMDFCLEEHSCFLTCRMRIFNLADKRIPMYWWSNMAVPEYEDGRLVVPANSAYTNDAKKVMKVHIPQNRGVDFTKYNEISSQIDLFFDINEDMPKYIANLDHNGHGLLHLSTGKLKSRKLFSWGKNDGSKHWQDFLTAKAGHYVEIQAGVSQTQYACKPMEKDEVWEWIEQYGPVSAFQNGRPESFEECERALTNQVNLHIESNKLDSRLKQTQQMADRKAEVIFSGSGYGKLHQRCTDYFGGKKIPAHLDFSSFDPRTSMWDQLLDWGSIPEVNPENIPKDFVSEEYLIMKLKESLDNKNRNNWYAYYQTGLGLVYEEKYDEGILDLKKAEELNTNAWTCHALASVYLLQGKTKEAQNWMMKGISFRINDLAYLKEGGRMLLQTGAYQAWSDIYRELSEGNRNDGRLLLYELIAMSHTKRQKQAYEILDHKKSMFLEDIREGENTVAELWQELHRSLFGEEGRIPERFCYDING